MFYLLQTGCQWRMLPRDFPPRSTVYGYFRAWITAGVWAHIHDVLYRRTRELEGRGESPTAAIIDSQSVRPAQKRGKWSATTPKAGQRVASGTWSPPPSACAAHRCPLCPACRIATALAPVYSNNIAPLRGRSLQFLHALASFLVINVGHRDIIEVLLRDNCIYFFKQLPFIPGKAAIMKQRIEYGPCKFLNSGGHP